MRLLNVATFQLETFHHSDLPIPEYAALSHTWGHEEVTFQDIMTGSGREKAGWPKILESAAKAAEHSCKYIWIDTCCIDKTSSAELSEAINSMFRWYQKCKICFAYLEDISVQYKATTSHLSIDSVLVAPGTKSPSPLHHPVSFSKARWFSRGWTLQELIAPEDSLKEMSEVTGIDADVIVDQTFLFHKSIAQKMSWASKRETTKIEDLAYCLMGIFGVNIPLLYGEGARAFTRLQEEIMRRDYDHSLFSWNNDFTKACRIDIIGVSERAPSGIGILAPHPSAFRKVGDIIPYTTKTEPYFTTNRGLQIVLRVLEHAHPEGSHTHIAILRCRYRNNLDTAIAIPIAPVIAPGSSNTQAEFYRTADDDLVDVNYSLVAMSKSQVVYLHEIGPTWRCKEPQNSHCCWLREYGQELGIRYIKAWSRQYPLLMPLIDEKPSKAWNYANNAMASAKDWRGTRAALFFSTKNGAALVVILTLMYITVGEGYPRMHVQIKPMLDGITEVDQASDILGETIPFVHGQELIETQTTFPFKGRIVTARLRRENMHDDMVFVLDLMFSGTTKYSSRKQATPNKNFRSRL
ncbi:hypothetical protein HBI32_128880 [Parastagonospora nodorum]|nr:hypothetical protein HBI32_128880 [Parastagonospora nodorum]